jgi:2,3-bisphosphoglycerate-independent phosphoglycerate mutase
MSFSFSKRPKPLVLCILDGWGINDDPTDNAIAQARTPFWDALLARYPHSQLMTSGLDVGLPEGQMGNSEVGHMNIGSGRVVMQELPRIDQAAQDGSLAQNPELLSFISTLKQSGGTCHIMGLLSDGGVHAHLLHITALATIISGHGIPVTLHAFLDGRDTPPSSALRYLEQCETVLKGTKHIRIATVSGRFYAMDRDNRWDRVARAYGAIADAEGGHAQTAREAVEQHYAQNITDEFITPTIIGDYAGMQAGDGLIMANFRSDRAREILSAFVVPGFDSFVRKRPVALAASLGMVEYSAALNAHVPALFRADKLEAILGEVVAEHGLTQLRIAETEKYAHVTFFFSGGREKEFPGEVRLLIPSPDVTTYDLQPEMSAALVTDALIEAVRAQKFDLIVVNYANSDMVGHTGDIAAAIKAIEALDSCLARLIPAVTEAGGITLITADHGNSEQMVDPDTAEPHTAHTMNPVPFVVTGKDISGITLKNGRLSDIAPTLLALMNIEKPPQMTGSSLIG